MKRISPYKTGALALLLTLGTSCEKYLDINNNPNGPERVDPALYLAPIQANYALAVQFDARGLGPYTQNFLHATSNNPWNIHGYNPGSDFGGELWRNVYWRGGYNLLDLMNQAREQKKWDLLGVGLTLQAWGWQMLTDYHGDIILNGAYTPGQNTFDYTGQEAVYKEVERLAREGIAELQKTGDGVGANLFGRFDLIYKGDRAKWQKFAWGLLALNYHHLSRKSSLYKPDSVIAFVDRSLSSNADDAAVPFNGTAASDASFFGPIRGNMPSFGQSAFITRILDSTGFGVKDPRRLIMLTPSGDGAYRGLTLGVTHSSTTSATATGIKNVWGTTLGLAAPTGTQGRFLFQNNAPFPLMTYAMLQFVKAEAAFIKGDKPLALAAFRNGINAHMDWVRTFNIDPLVGTRFNSERTAYLADVRAVPADPQALTLSQILLQKYVAQWGWGFLETWTDLRRYNYSADVFTGLTVPDATILYTDNNGKLANRVRPRYNSEYTWNIEALTKIGGFDLDYHTKPMWFQQP